MSLLELPADPAVVDLDEYRRKREEEGSWPIPDDEYRKYWEDRRAKRKPEYNKPGGGSVAKPEPSAADIALMEALWGPFPDGVHPI